jgi:catechol-2,3-dioxygenase
MKRFHVHVAVDNLDESIKFYSSLFDAVPSVSKTDYAKWMLDDPRLNFAISKRGRTPGLDHLGMQVEDAGELAEIANRLHSANQQVLDEGETTCCYAKSEKAWVMDPQGIAWESFLTVGESTVYGEDQHLVQESSSACCVSPASIVPVSIERKNK